MYSSTNIPGGPELFHKYIGDYHGIQGNYTIPFSYLDAAIFALFALSDSFDELLQIEAQNLSATARIIQFILQKEIINPLRRYMYMSMCLFMTVAHV